VTERARQRALRHVVRVVEPAIVAKYREVARKIVAAIGGTARDERRIADMLRRELDIDREILPLIEQALARASGEGREAAVRTLRLIHGGREEGHRPFAESSSPKATPGDS